MKTYGTITVFFLLAISFAFVSGAYAATPVLSFSTGGGDSMQVNVTGDPNTNVAFFYNVGGSGGMQTRNLGTTNSSGYLSTLVSTGAFGINYNSLVYVVVNGQQSTMATWPYGSSSSGNLSLGQNNLTLSVGQSTTVTVYGATNLTVINNSAPSVANFAINGTQVTVTANNQGATTATICDQYNQSNCVNLFVTVQNSGTQFITFGTNNISLTGGQSLSTSISGGSGSYYISSNSNSSIVAATITGSSILLTANNTGGSTVITVCATGTASCGTLSVTVSGTGSGITFSQSTVSLTSGANQAVTIYGSGGYSISNNSNSSIASATLNGNTLTIYGLSTGNTGITVCQQGGNCSVLSVVVNGGSGNTGSVYFSQASPTLTIGQSATIVVSGGSTNYYVSSNSNPNVASASLNGSILTLTGNINGATSINICSVSGGASCGTLYVTVGSTSGSTGVVVFSQTSENLMAGQTFTVSLSGGSSPYYLSGASNNVVQASVSGNSLMLSAVNAGSASLNICSSSGGCSTLLVTVYPTSTSGSITLSNDLLAQIQALQSKVLQLQAQAGTSGKSDSGGSSKYKFTSFLSIGYSGTEVTELQKRLTAEGVYNGAITGYYGASTAAAVRKFQSRHGIKQAGYVGPSTRAALNGG